MKKLICSILSLVMLVSMLGSCNNTSDDLVKSTTQDQTEESTVNEETTETPTTEMPESPVEDFKYKFSEDQNRVFITQYVGTSKNVVIPSKIEEHTVTSLIGYQVDDFLHGVFQGTDIETVVIPDTIKVMGGSTFKDCTSLYSVTIKQNSELREIGNQVFRNCSSLKIINLEDAENLKTIGAYAFENCKAIEEIELPCNLETIGKSAFFSCLSLKSVNIPSKLNLLEDFEGPRFSDVPMLEEIIFDNGWQNIHGYVFFEITSTVSITIPKGVKSIDADLFSNIGSINLFFLGDCPELLEYDRFAGNVTIYYDSSASGWDTTPLKDSHTLIPN